MDDAVVDLASNGIDVAFRTGTPAIYPLKVRKLVIIKSSVVASPDYLSKRTATRWVFFDEAHEIVATVPRRLMVNSDRVARDWAVAGCRITYYPDFVLGRYITEGRLVRLLEGYGRPQPPLQAIYLDANVLPRKVRTLIDFAVEDVKDACIL